MYALPELKKNKKIDALRLILGVLIVSSKREVYTAKLSFIWVVKERGRGRVRNFLLLCVSPPPPP